ncbi:MAG: hypothetical protein JZU50_05890 [Desulfobulbaceae bacterium]|nr:hypothetical protein [Desulfobulbaceae bacterium]
MKTMKSIVFASAVLLLPVGVLAQQEMRTVDTVTTTESAGTISDVGPGTIVVRSETSSSPTNYSSTKSTTYVDDTGAPVSVETVRSGQPVTVYYTREGDRMVADKVVVRKTTTTTEVPAPIIQEKRTRTSTTTETKY